MHRCLSKCSCNDLYLLVTFIIKLCFFLVDHSEGDVRLADSAGVVEVFTAGDWHPVCADDEWDAMAINRLCIDLGHTSGVVQSPQPLLSDTVIRTSVSCNASNEHLSECLPDSLDLRSGSQCPSNTVLTVDCEATSELYTHLHSCSCAYKSDPHYFRTDSMCMLHRMRMPGYSLPRPWPPSFIPHACTQQTNMTLYNLCIDYTYVCMHCLHTCRNFIPSNNPCPHSVET